MEDLFKKYGKLIADIREIYRKHGARFMNAPTEFEFKSYRKTDGDILFDFDNKRFTRLITPDGDHPVLGVCAVSNVEETFNSLVEFFGLEEVTPFVERHSMTTGPIYRVTKNI